MSHTKIFVVRAVTHCMGDFDLDLGSIEENIEGGERRVILDILDESTSGETWVADVADGNIIVLHVIGDLDEVVGDFAEKINSLGGSIVHFRSFLILSPPGIEIDTDRL